MKLEDLGEYEIVSEPSRNSGFSIDQRNIPIDSFDDSQSALAQSQSLMDNAFRSPLQAIVEGDAGANIERAKGVGKQALSEFSSAGIHKAGPVGQAMMGQGLAKGNTFAQGLTDLDKTLVSSNIEQMKGKFETGLLSSILPMKPLVSAVSNSGILKTLGQKTGISKFLANRAEQKTVSAVTPKFTLSELREAPNVVKPRFGDPYVDLSKDKRFMETVSDVKDIVKGKSAIKDKNALMGAIEKTSESEVKPFLSSNRVPANFEDLQKKLSLVHPKSSLKADPSSSKTYSRIREEVQSSLYDFLKERAKGNNDFGNQVDFNDVWDARKILDAKSEEELGAKVFGTPEYTGAKAAIQDMRQALTQYIKDSLQFPGQMEDVNRMQEFIQVARQRGIQVGSNEAKGLMQQMGIRASPEDIAKAKVFEDAMRRVSNYYKAVENVSTKVPQEIRKGGIIKKTIKNPFVQAGIGAGIGGGIVGAGVSTIKD